MPAHRHLRATTRGALAVAAALLLTAGCTSSSDGSEDGQSEDANKATAAAIRDDIATWPGVTRVDETYQDNLTAPGTLAIGLSVEPDVDRDAMRDKVYRAVWLSDIDPLDRIALRIGDGTTTGDVADYSINIDSGVSDDLTEQFGPRP